MARYPTYDEYRDKPKKGITKCDELLKRTPKDIQLLATKSQLLTELGETAKAQVVINQLLVKQPPSRDLQEITLIEDAVVEHLQSNTFPQPLSAGPDMAKVWENAAKAATAINYKLDLQSLRFTRAIFDNRLQDAQQALIQLKALLPKNKVFYMAHLAVTQMLSTGSEDLSSRLALMLAKKAVAEKFDEVRDLDCRVPGQIFAIQGNKEELESIKGGRFAESKHVYDALREGKKLDGKVALGGLNIDDARFGTPEWLDAIIAESKAKFATLLKDSNRMALYSFAAESTETYCKAIQSIDQFRYRHVCQLIFLAISTLVRIWEQHNETDALLQAAFIGELLLRNNQHIHEAKVILIHLYMRLDLAVLALKHWSSLSVKEIQLDTMGHVFLTNISLTHPHKATTSTARTNDPLTITNQALSMYIRCEQKLAECEAKVLNNGQTGMILDLHDLRENLRLSLSRRLFSLEQRRLARFFRSPALDSHAIHIEPRLTAQWLLAKDNRDFAAAFSYAGYSAERALHGLADGEDARAYILRGLATDTAWCLATGAVPPVKDTAVLIQHLSDLSSQPSSASASANASALSTAESTSASLSLATLQFLSTPSPQTLTALKSALRTLTPQIHTQTLKPTYLHLDALRTILASLKHAEQLAAPKALPKAELDGVRREAEERVATLQAHAKEQSRKANGQSVRAGFETDVGVWTLFGEEDLVRFAGDVADAEGSGWEGVSRLR